MLEAIKNGFTGLLLWIDGIVYWFLSLLFNLFESLAKVEIIKQSQYQEVANRFYIVIGIFMLFYIAYSLLKAIVNPDEINKTTSKIVQNAIISIILLSIMPTIFSTIFNIQNIVISEHVIDHLIFGNVDQEKTISDVGREMAMTSLEAFLHIPDKTENKSYVTWGELKNVIYETGDFTKITSFASVVNNEIDGSSYTGIISTICGVFLAYIVMSFCLDLGIRVVKLAFYQITSPIPVMLRIIPEKKTVFNNWVKKTLATFFEVFVRLFIIYIICFFADLITRDTGLFIVSDQNINLIAKVVIYLGLFAFAKQAPKLISDVTGIDSGGIKLGIGGKLKESFSVMGSIPIVGKLGQRAVGAVTGGLGAGLTSLANGAGFGSGFAYGSLNGWKNKGLQFKKQRERIWNDAYGESGKPGLFGGKPMFDRTSDSVKKEAKVKYSEHNETIVENNPQFQSIYQGKLAEEIRQLTEVMNEAKETFTANQEKEIERLEALLQNEKHEYEISKRDRLARLKEEAQNANTSNNRAEVARISQEYQRINAEEYSNPRLQTEINELRNRKFDDSSYKAQIDKLQDEIDGKASLSKEEKAKFVAAATKQFKSSSGVNYKYKAAASYLEKEANRRAAEQYQNSPEGMAQAKAISDAIAKQMKGQNPPGNTKKT